MLSRQPDGCIAQQNVAEAVADGVVDLLELVQIDEQNGDFCTIPRRARQSLVQPVQHQGAVGKASDRIDCGLDQQAFLVGLALGDVERHGYDKIDSGF